MGESIQNPKSLNDLILMMSKNLCYSAGITDIYGIFEKLNGDLVFHELVESKIIEHFEEKKGMK